MTPHPLTVSTPAHALAGLTSAELAATQLQGRCTARVCYTPTATAAGQRAYGHFSMDAAILAEAVGRHVSPREFNDAPSADSTLHRWLSDHDSADATDESVSTIPPAWPGLEHVVEELLFENQVRIFCTCCNRNLAAREVRLARTLRETEGVHSRYLCTQGHLLLGLHAGQILVAAEAHAA